MDNSSLRAPDYAVRYMSRGQIMPRCLMEFGRLIRVRKSDGDPKGVAYIVAVQEPIAAIRLIQRQVAEPHDRIEDLGRVSDALLKTLGLSEGEFVRADEKR
jgi:hypothetical protein